ncbi:MAG: hypothetical protein J0L78_00810 [Planctomycetes bacterium]|nr:hypothetical protein [Planctomycetota bacterium]
MSTTPLHFEYTLAEHGWARTALTIGGQRHEFENAFGSDPIGSLAQLAIRFAAKTGVPKTEIVFDCENRGDYIAQFTHRDPSKFEFWHQPMQGLDGIERPRTHFASCEIDSFAFALNIARILDHLFRTHGFVGYLRSWQHFAFPLREYFFLRLLLDESPIIHEITRVSNASSFELELDLLRHEPVWANAPRTNGAASIELPYEL